MEGKTGQFDQAREVVDFDVSAVLNHLVEARATIKFFVESVRGIFSAERAARFFTRLRQLRIQARRAPKYL